MDIEVLATSAVKDAISWTQRLSPYISEKDKEPIWDGSVHVYATPSKNNANHLGRVPVQVKGRSVSEFSSRGFFDVAVCDLKNFLREGGVIFFVVELSETTKEKEIFYNSLLPYDLLSLIEEAGQQEKKRILLYPFPKEPVEIESIFTNFLSDQQKQLSLSSIGRRIPVEEFVQKQGYPIDISMSFIKSTQDEDFLDHFINNGMYIYVNSDFGISFPVGHITNVQMATVEVDLDISCQGRTFYRSYRKTRYKSGYEVSFGKSLRFYEDKNKEETSINVKLAGTLSERILDCEFVLAIFKNKGFCIGNQSVPIDANEFDDNMTEKWQGHLSFLKSIKSALDYMGVIADLDCDKLTEEDNKKIVYGLLPAAEGKSFQIDTFNDALQPTILTICNLNILMLALRQPDGRYIFKNYFTANLGFVLQTADGLTIPSTCYALLDKADILRLSNLDYGHMAEKMKLDSPHYIYCGKVNEIVLNLLSAYDEAGCLEILHTAQELAAWLCTVDCHNVVYRLNYLQSSKRERVLTASELCWLQSIVANQGTEDVCKMGAYILLEDYSNAAIFFDGLSKDIREESSEYPIMTLWER